jgi:hypothetical protein
MKSTENLEEWCEYVLVCLVFSSKCIEEGDFKNKDTLTKKQKMKMTKKMKIDEDCYKCFILHADGKISW